MTKRQLADPPLRLRLPSKYGNRRTEVDSIVFASKREAERYQNLCLLEKAGEISDLSCQPRFPLVVQGMKVCTYVADFEYREKDNPVLVVEDVKGHKTREYVLKKKLMKALYGIDVRET